MNNKIEKHGNNKGGNPNWTKGVSGNPNGRPKRIVSLTSEMKAQLGNVCPYDSEKRTWLQYLVERWLAHSIENATYFRELIERLEGKVTQPIGGDEEKPFRHVIQVVDNETKKALTDFLQE